MRYVEISNIERDTFPAAKVLITEYANSLRFFVSERLFLLKIGSGSLYGRYNAFIEELE